MESNLEPHPAYSMLKVITAAFLADLQRLGITSVTIQLWTENEHLFSPGIPIHAYGNKDTTPYYQSQVITVDDTEVDHTIYTILRKGSIGEVIKLLDAAGNVDRPSGAIT